MTPAAVALICISAVTHAYWNFLFKRAGGGNLFIGLSKIAEALVFAPVFLFWGLPTMPKSLTVALILVVTVVGVLVTYSSLSQAYRHGDLSYAYPISRGSMLLFLPFLAFWLTGEHVDSVGASGLVFILIGVVVLQLKELRLSAIREVREHVNGRGLSWALFTGLMLAVYTLWDKHAVAGIPPFAYLYSYTAVTAVAYALYMWTRIPRVDIEREWSTKRGAIVQVGVLNTISYLLALFALRTGVSSYVIGVRQLSIAIGVIFGWRLLGEALTPP
ncbi:MAG: EamA family transporter, partial [Gemmatimonadaceae bacterium]